MNKAAPPQDALLHASALLIAVAVTMFTGWLLLDVPAPMPAQPALDVVLIERVPPPVEPPSEPDFVPVPMPRDRPHAPQTASVAANTPRPVQPEPSTPRKQTAANTPPPARPSRLFNADGRVALPEADPMRAPPGRAPGDPDDPKFVAAKNTFERRNPIDVPPTGFESDWATEGTLGKALLGKATKRLQKIADAMPFKRDIQQARARPPPPVRFNPALHERPSDLGSEATGDAYKAAPIAFEPAPGLQGEASRRIRQAIGEVEAAHGGCERKRLRELLAPAIVRVDELQRIERAMASGVDPIRAEQLLPRSADMAYDQARRAIWYAKQQLATCAS